jgi:predicted nucleotidyltransferase
MSCHEDQYTLTISPLGEQSGISTILISISDTDYTITRSFDVTINALPEISDISNQQTFVNYALSLPFFITDDVGGDISFIFSTSNNSLVNATGLSITGSVVSGSGQTYTLLTSAGVAQNYTLLVVPEIDQSGTADITITVTDRGSAFDITFTALFLELFTEDVSVSIPGYYNSSLAYGDYDNDGDLDLFFVGDGPGDNSELYRNTDGHFENANKYFYSLSYGSVAFGDYDNDNDLDIFITGSNEAYIYKNNGTSFSKVMNLNDVNYSSTAFGDYDNDGDLDILLTGSYGSNKISKLYRNTGGQYIEDTYSILTGVSHGSVKFGDYDNDGDIDILLTGMSNNGRIAKLYRNTESIFVEDINVELPAVYYSSVAFGDYDNDNDLDIFISGSSNNGYIAKIFRNTDGNFEEDTNSNFTGVQYSSAAFGDYDSDGDLDLLVTGYSYSSKLYRNTGNHYIEETGVNLTGISYGSVAFGDHDNDGDLDIIISGRDTSSTEITKVYTNNLNKANTPPSEPTDLSATVIGNQVSLSWSASSDAETLSASGLNYNLCIGTTSGSGDILAPMSLPLSSGLRQVAAMGLIQTLTKTIHINTTGTYYWSVQSIDTVFAGSAFSNEYTFSVTDIAPVSGNNGMLSTSTLDPFADEVTISWQEATDDITLTPSLEYRVYTSTVSYGENVNAWEYFGSAVSDWVAHTNTLTIKNLNATSCYYLNIIVRDETGNSSAYSPAFMSLYSEVTDIELPGVRYSAAEFVDYDNDEDLDIIISGEKASGRVSKMVFKNTGSDFIEEDINFYSYYYTSMALGDYDNDADIDIFITGSSDTEKLYQNTGSTFIEDTLFKFPDFSNPATTFGDFDNDGDLDILLTGHISTRVSKIFCNTQGKFTVVSDTQIEGVNQGSVDFGDYDNDGDLDILLTGYTNDSNKISKIYKNTNGFFSEDSNISLSGVYLGSAKFGDLDNDGDLDLILAGNSIAKIYQNTENTYIEYTSITLPGVKYSSVALGDYDNDGDLDFLLTGRTDDNDNIAKAYKNQNGEFTEDTGIKLTGVYYGSVTFGDYDKDNDLDILLTGDSGSEYIAKIYRNNLSSPNTPPTEPTALNAVVTGQKVMLSWSASSDAETISSAALNYNLRMGTSSGAIDIISPMSIPQNGEFRQIAERGMIQNLTATVNLPEQGTYYWSVQAIDTSYASSHFSSESSFTISDLAPVPGNNGILQYPQLYDLSDITINWELASDAITLTSNLEYRVYTAMTYYGDHVDMWEQNAFAISDWMQHTHTFTIPNNASNFSELNNLCVAVMVRDSAGNKSIYRPIKIGFYEDMPINDPDHFSFPGVQYSSSAFGDYDNDGDLDIILTGYTGSKRISKIYRNVNGIFSEDTNTHLPGVRHGSVAFGDYDADGDLDILLSGETDNSRITKLFLNSGGVFHESTDNRFPGIIYGSSAFADVDNDGDLDILLSGKHYSGGICKLFLNTNGKFIEDTGIDFPDVYYSSVAFGDYDNDTDLDVLVAGRYNFNNDTYYILKMFNNKGGSFTENTNLSFDSIYYGSIAFGDYDNDRFLDLIKIGSGNDRLYHNDQGNFSINNNISLNNYYDGTSLQFGDLDNDGDLDILCTGDYKTKFYENINGSFTEDTTLSLIHIDIGSVILGDYDNDGDLDILISGYDGYTSVTKLYRRNLTTPNNPPATPTGLNASVSGKEVLLSWSESNDPETIPKSGLSYNLRVGTTPGGIDVMSPMAYPLSSGYRQLPLRGMIQTLTKNITMNTPGTYYWSVQTIDTSFSGSAFSAEYSFTVTDTSPIPGNNGTINYSQLTYDNDTILNWEFASDTITASNLLEYRVYTSTDYYGRHIEMWEENGMAISDWIPHTNTISVDRLSIKNNYYLTVIVRDEFGNKAIYQPVPISTYSDMSMIAPEMVMLTPTDFGEAIFGDYDNDGDMDILHSGHDGNRYDSDIYTHSGNQFNVNDTIDIVGLSNSSQAFGDYNNDGDLDMIIFGTSYSSGSMTTLYRNSGGNYIKDTTYSFPYYYYGSSVFGDYDNDGDLDILLTGRGYARLYCNNDGHYSYDTNNNLPNFSYTSADFGDYDNDGDIDILLTGSCSGSCSGKVSKVYKNSGGLFSEDTSISLHGVYQGSSKFGDYDNDGKLDILLTGRDDSDSNIAKIYHNSNGLFTEVTDISLPEVYYGDVAFGDYDNDGDLDFVITGKDSDNDTITSLYKNNDGHFNHIGLQVLVFFNNREYTYVRGRVKGKPCVCPRTKTDQTYGRN